MSSWADSAFGTHGEQTGTASDPGQAWMQRQLQPGIQQMIQNYSQGQQGYSTPLMPNLGTYQVPQAQYSTPMDYINSTELNTAQNLREQFYGGGGGGSAMGGVSGQGQVFDSNLAAQLSQGAVGRFNQYNQFYDQLQAQQAQNVWGANTNLLGQQYGLQAQAMNPQWLYNMYSGTYGEPIVNDQGQLEGGGGIFGLFGNLF